MCRYAVQTPSLLLVNSADLAWPGLRSMVRALSEVRVVGEAVDAGQVLRLADELQPDLILLGMELNGDSTVPLIGQIRARCHNARVMICAGAVADGDLAPLARAGVACCLLWNDAKADAVYHSLAALSTADLVIGSRVLMQAFVSAYCPQIASDDLQSCLAPQEFTVTSMLACGKRPHQIAAELYVTPQTVAEHLRRAREKLGAHTNTHLACLAVTRGIITPPR
jgi:DNA-binding NarL/FixJ family response regulator